MTRLSMVLTAAALLALSGRAPALAAPIVVATVDVAAVAEALPEGRTAKAKLSDFARDRAHGIEREKLDLNEAIQRAEGTHAADAAKDPKVQELYRRRQALMARAHGLSLELQREEQRLFQPVLDRVNKVVAAVAREQGVALVLRRPLVGAVYQAPDAGMLDLTPAVVARARQGAP